MRVELPAGNYVIAVSGGIDSMVLLDLLQSQPGLQLTVAHYDHGIRPDSRQDRLLVQRTAQAYGLKFMSESGQLGPAASEATARTARYRFLHQVQRVTGAQAIVIAHHQDDVLETIIINLLRGTGRKGLSSLASSQVLIRPLLEYTKSQIIDYATRQRLVWHEDSTNSNIDYLRNRIRQKLLPAWSQSQKQQLLTIGRRMTVVNQELDTLLEPLIGQTIPRHWFTSLPNSLALEVMASWLRRQGNTDFDRHRLQRLVVAAKVGLPGRAIDISRHQCLQIGTEQLKFQRIERPQAAGAVKLALRV